GPGGEDSQRKRGPVRTAPTANPGASLGSPAIDRLSLNQITAERASLKDAVEACARHGVPYIAVWRHKLAETGLDRAVRIVRDAGLSVPGVRRGGVFPASTRAGREAGVGDNRGAVEEAAADGG